MNHNYCMQARFIVDGRCVHTADLCAGRCVERVRDWLSGDHGYNIGVNLVARATGECEQCQDDRETLAAELNASCQ